jgi:phosphoglycerate dehydrogenase-like enzyme
MPRLTLLYYQILKYQPENLKLLYDHFNVISLPEPTYDTPSTLVQADIVLAPLGYYFGKDKIDQASKLKIIASNTTGNPHIDVGYARQKGIKVVTLKGENSFLEKITPTAEFTWGLIIALTRNMFPAYHSVLKGCWDRRPFGGPSMLSNMSLGIAGCGRLGSMVASYGRCFGMVVQYYDPFVSRNDLGAERTASLKELVQSCDIITVHIPHEKTTENLFNREIFSHFRKGSYFINTSRGELVDHQALLECLMDGRLAGAALDVLEGEFEPEFGHLLKNHPLWQYAQKHGNLILTPHIGGSTVDAWRLTEGFTIRMVLDVLKTHSKNWKKESWEKKAR